LGGCAQTEAAAPSTLSTLVRGGGGPTTTVAPAPIADVNGYVVSVIDGMRFELQVKQATQPGQLSHIVIPPLGTCEGDAAKQWLTTVVFGHPVRIDGNGVVWLNDIDVAKAIVAYGYAKAADGTYSAEDAASPDFDCSATTTSTTAPLPVVVIPAAPKTTKPPKPKVTVPRTQAPVVTDAPPAAPTEPSPLETSPPETVRKTQPEPVVTDAPVETPPQTLRKRPGKPKH
jgi:endonuclease YncB( thermonuclease family)